MPICLINSIYYSLCRAGYLCDIGYIMPAIYRTLPGFEIVFDSTVSYCKVEGQSHEMETLENEREGLLRAKIGTHTFSLKHLAVQWEITRLHSRGRIRLLQTLRDFKRSFQSVYYM